jgi:hypothetical protein
MQDSEALVQLTNTPANEGAPAAFRCVRVVQDLVDQSRSAIIIAKLREIKAELRRRMHDPAASVGEWLKSVTLGYYNYYAVPGNIDRLSVFAQRRLRRLCWLILSRRSQRGRTRWDWLTPIFQRWIPGPRVLHPYPYERFVATHPRWEPYA